MAIDVKCPIKYFEENLVFTADGSCWAAYQVTGYDYDFLNSDKKIDLAHQLALFVSSIYSQAKILVIPSRQDVENNFKNLKAQLRNNDPLYSAALYHATGAEPYLKKESSMGSTYKTFVIFRLLRGDDTDFVISRLKELFETFALSINRVNKTLGADTENISTRRLNSYRKTAEKIQLEQTRRLQIIPTTTLVTQWLFTRCMHRGLPQEEKIPQIGCLSDKRDILALFRGRITKNNRSLCISHSNKTESHQAFLVIQGLPTSSVFPGGSEWIYFAQRLFGDDGLPCNVEMILNIEKIEFRKALKKVNRQKRQAKEQAKEVGKADPDAEMPQNLEESHENITSLEAELRLGRFPLLETSVVLCLASDNKDEMEKKADFVRQEYEDAGYFVERPYATQLNLFMSYFPGTTGITKDYIMKLPPYVIAAGIFGANNLLGSIVGPPVGWTVNPNNRNPQQRNEPDPIERIFKLDMREAIQNNRSGSLFITGDLGFGKSMLTKLLIYLHVLYFRARAFIFDPKNECNDWDLSLPSLAGLIATVRMSPDPEYQGMMDPFALFDINTAIEVAHSILVDILHLHGNSETALTAGLEVIRNDSAPSMLRLAEILDSFVNAPDIPEYLPSLARDLAFKIRLKKNAGMCRLLIGDGQKTLKLDSRINILQIQGLKDQLPLSTKPRSDYTEDEKIATSLMKVAAKFSLKFLENNQDVLRILGYDEAWAIKDTETGAGLINSASRTGRSLYSLSILNGHSIDDLPGGAVHNTITYFACFHTNEQEAIKVLDFLGMEKTEGNVKLITTLKNGQCLFRDMDGNIGIVQVDLIYEDIIQAFSTTPQETRYDEKEALYG